MTTKKNDPLINKLVDYTLQLFLKKTDLKNLNYIPRWIVLLIDVGLITLAGILTHFLLDGLGISYFNPSKIKIAFSLFILVHLFYFLKFGTYLGVVRHSTLLDALKIFISESAAFITLFILNWCAFLIIGQKLFLSTRLLIAIIISYILLLGFRFLIKISFQQASRLSPHNKKELVLIYGSGDIAIAIASSIMHDEENHFKVLGFIDPKTKSYNKILNLPLYNSNRRVPVIARAHAVKTIIFSENKISSSDKIDIIEDCLNHNIKVLTLPEFTDISEAKNISSKIRNIKIEDLLDRKPISLESEKISKQLKDRTILISGAAGSIGSEIVCQVAKFNPSKIILLDQAETPLHNISLEIAKCNTNSEIILEISDIRNTVTLEKIFKNYQPDIVYHAAAYKHVPLMEENPSQAIHTNVIGTKNLADLSIKYNVKRFVMVSTDKAVNPSNVMGCSKRIAEMYVQSLSTHLKNNTDSKTKFITTRFGNVLGSNGSVVPLFTKQIENGGPITITHPDIIRYFMTIPEACQLVLEAGSMGNGGEIYIFDMGKPVKIINLANKMIKLAGLKPDIDIKIKIVGLRPGEKLYEELLNDTSTTLPTYHEKIMIAHDNHVDYLILKKHITELLLISENHNKSDIVMKMKEIVPEYKSMNSQYEKLDTEI